MGETQTTSSIQRQPIDSLATSVILTKVIQEPVRLGVRRSIQTELTNLPPPEVPKGLQDADKFYSSVQNAAHSTWIKASEKSIHSLLKESAQRIADLPENQSLIDFLNSPGQVKQSLERGDYVKFADLARVDLDIWLALLTAFSLEQQYSHEIELQWSKSISKNALDRFGVKREELVHLAAIKKDLQPDVDEAFMKQLEFENKLAGDANFRLWPVQNDGDQYVYEVTWPDGLQQRIPYSRAFAPEFSNIASTLTRVAIETRRLVEEGELPESYLVLAESAQILIPMYGSGETGSKQIQNYHGKIKDFYRDHTDSDWAAILTGMDYALQSGRVWVALNLNWRTPTTRELDRKYSDPYREKFATEARNFSGVQATVRPPIFVNTGKSASKLYWAEIGVQGVDCSFVNANIIEQKSPDLYETTRKFFNQPISLSKFILGQRITTQLHEGGHTLGNMSGINKETLISLYGTAGLDDIIDELISDHAGVLPVFDSIIEKGQPITAEGYIYAMIAGYYRDIAEAEDVQSFDFEIYGLSGRIIIGEICKSGAIKMENSKISIIDPQAGMRAIRAFALELKEIRNSEDLSPDKAEAFLAEVQGRIPTDGVYAEVIQLFQSNNAR